MKEKKKFVVGEPHVNAKKIVGPFRNNFAPSTQPINFTYRGGPILQSPKLSTIFWGRQWNEAFVGFPPKIDAYLTDLVKGPLFDQLQEYNTPSVTIGHGSYAGSRIVTNPSPSKFIFDFQIRSMLQGQIASGNVPGVTPNNLYIVFTPPGSAVIKGFSISCLMFCGYHDTINNNIFYAVMNYPACNGCKPNLPDMEALTTSVSHEICEAITDPLPGTGWYDTAHGEIGDVCPWQTKMVNGYRVQKEWSQVQGKCV